MTTMTPNEFKETAVSLVNLILSIRPNICFRFIDRSTGIIVEKKFSLNDSFDKAWEEACSEMLRTAPTYVDAKGYLTNVYYDSSGHPVPNDVRWECEIEVDGKIEYWKGEEVE